MSSRTTPKKKTISRRAGVRSGASAATGSTASTKRATRRTESERQPLNPDDVAASEMPRLWYAATDRLESTHIIATVLVYSRYSQEHANKVMGKIADRLNGTESGVDQ